MTATTLRKIVRSADAVEEPEEQVAAQPQVRTAYVPDIDIYHRYQGRSFEGTSEFQIFEYAMRNKQNILIEGPTGDGKTMASMAFAAMKGLNFYSIPCNVGVNPSQLTGMWTVGHDGIPVWVDGGLTYLVRHGGVLLINEINALPPKIAMLIFSLLDHRREVSIQDHMNEVIKAHPDLLIVADCNPGYAGTTALNPALRNRFPIQLAWDYDDDVERRLVRSKTLREHIAAGLRQQFREGKLFTPCSTNMLMEFEQLGLGLGIEFAISNFINHFDEQERQAVGLVFTTYKANLAAEFVEMADTGPDNPNKDHILFRDTDWIYGFPGSNS